MYPAGAVVTLDPKDAAPFLDKLIPLDDAPAPARAPVPLKNELHIEIEPGARMVPIEAGDVEEDVIDLVAQAKEEQESEVEAEPVKKTSRKKKS